MKTYEFYYENGGLNYSFTIHGTSILDAINNFYKNFGYQKITMIDLKSE